MRKSEMTKVIKKGAVLSAFAVLAAGTILFTGCSKNGGTSGSTGGAGLNAAGNDSSAGSDYENADYAYLPDFSTQETELGDEDDEDLSGCNAYFVKKGMSYSVIGTWKNENKIIIIKDITTGEQSIKHLIPDGKEKYSKFFNTVNGFAIYDGDNNAIYMYDDNWEQKGIIDIGSADRNASGGFIGQSSSGSCIIVDNEGNTAVLLERSMLLFDSEFNLTRNISFPDKVLQADELIATQSGNRYLICDVRGEDANTVVRAIYQVDMQEGVAGEALDIPYDIVRNSAVYSTMNSIDENGFYIHGKDYIYRYDESTGEFIKLFRPSDYGINVSLETIFGVGDGGCFYIANKELGSTDGSYELATVNRVPSSQVKERTQLVLGAVGVSSSIYDPILKFNKYNQDYYVKINDYSDGVDDYQVARQNFYNDLLKGEGSDIFYVNQVDMAGGINIANLGDKGIVSDLYEFIDKDETLSREDFVPNLLSRMEQAQGKLYALYFEPQFTFFAGKASIFGDCKTWDYTSLLEIMNAYPDAVPIADLNRGWVLQQFMWYSMGAFYNSETGECNFDTDEFKNMLKIIEKVPEQIDFDIVQNTQGEKSISGMLDRDEVLIYDQCDLSWDEKLYFGDSEVKYLGIPSSGGEAGVDFFFGLAINAQSENAQAAWEFVKNFLDKDFQMSGMFPIMNAYVDAKIEDMMPKNSNDKKNEEEIEKIKNRTHYILDNCVSRKDYDSDIYSIISEETDAYFSGSRGLDETVSIIQNRIQLYIDEKR